ncbi:MAG: hypothetical protein ING02_11460 [Roseomonas sp.]|nr:hypothetical protein [Roseomonas sp.]
MDGDIVPQWPFSPAKYSKSRERPVAAVQKPVIRANLIIRGGRLPAAEFAALAAPHAQQVAQELARAVQLSRGAIGLPR